jgi:MSHA biogenesis protein MshI
MKALFARRRSREPGWLAVSLQPGGVSFAHGVCESGKKCSITSCGTRSLDGSAKDLEHVAKDLGVERYRCLTLLPQSDYQLLLVEAPNVPATELKTAVRWRLKDMLDYHVDDATIDVLDIPVDPSGAARGHSMYAVAARNDIIQACIERFSGAHVPLSVIDIAETAQRNIAALYEPSNRGIALVYLAAKQALLTINFRGELYMTRRMDFGTDQLLEGTAAQREEALNRILLELQRSFDHLDRQFPFVTLAKLLLAPEPRDTGLAAHLAKNLDLPVERVELGEVIDFAPGAALDADAAWRMFHVVGAALRNETKAL